MEILEQLLDDLEGKVLLFALSAYIALVATLLMGCSTTAVGEPETRGAKDRFKAEVVNSGFNYSLTVVTDTKEGCQYLFLKSGQGAGFIQLTDKYGNPLLADDYSRREVGMSDDDEE